MKTMSGATRPFDPEGWQGLPGALDLKAESRGILRALFLLRDERSRKLNITPFRYIPNRELVELARNFPGNRRELEMSGLVHSRLLAQEGDRILAARENARPVRDGELPVHERPDPVFEARFRLLKKWRGSVAKNRNMDPSVILNNRVLQQIAKEEPAGLPDLEKLGIMSPLKIRIYGQEILSVLRTGEVPDS